MNDDFPRQDHHPELEEELLHGLFSEEPGAQWESLLARPGAREELADLEAFLAGCKTALRPDLDLDVERVTERVLSATTRNDPSWRGDLRLVRKFVAARWRASSVFRLAAASLLIHVAALPLLAYYSLQSDEPEFTISFAPRPAAPVADLLEPEHDVDFAEAPADEASAVVDPLAIENALRWARFHLERGAPQAPHGGEAGSELTRMLALRAGFLNTSVAGEFVAPALEAGVEALGPVARVVWFEHLLDRFVLEGQVPEEFDRARMALVRSLEGPLEGSQPTLRAARRLEFGALARAEAYGLLDERERGELARERFETGQLGPDEALAFDALATGGPLGGVFHRALVEAARAELSADGVGRAWLSWGE